MTTADAKLFKNEELILPVPTSVDPLVWDETKYDEFLDELCGHREYQKEAIRVTLRFLLSGKANNLRALASAAFQASGVLQSRYGSWAGMERHLQFPDKLSCSLDLATATGKSYVLYGLAAIMLAEGAVDRVLVLCPSNTIESGLTQKFKYLAGDSRHRDAMPIDAEVQIPRVINATQTILAGDICIENYHAVLEHVKSSVRDSLRGAGQRTLILNDESHHVANESGTESRRWKEFLEDPVFGFRYLVGVSGTCYVGDEYFADVVYRYSLRQAMEERHVKKVEYVAEMPDTGNADEKWQLVHQHHEASRRRLRSRGIRPLTIVVTDKIHTCDSVADEIVDFLCQHEHLDKESASDRVLPVSSSKHHQRNVAKLRDVDSPGGSKVEWIVSVAMLTEGWDVKNVFQIVPHEERAFNSKLLIAQVLGRGLRRPDLWSGEEPVVTVFNHDSWSTRIKQLVNEVLEIEQRLTATTVPESSFHFTLHQIDYTRTEDTTSYTKTGEYNMLTRGYVDLPTQVENEDVEIALERAVTGERSLFRAKLRHKTFSVEEVAGEMFRRLRSIDEENATGPESQRTRYAERFPLAACDGVVRKSLEMAHIKSGRVTDGNRQKFLQALGTLHRKSAKRVIYTLSPDRLREISTKGRQDESCSAAELRRGARTLFFTEDTASSLPDVQVELFEEVTDEDGPFAGAIKRVANPADFKTCMSMLLADGTPERKFASYLVKRENSQAVDAWFKNAAVHFYTIEYAWKKGEHPKRGEFSPDFFLRQGNRVYVVEIKDDGEISDPSPENTKKHQYASQHFERLNCWLEREGIETRYQFNMVTPKNFVGFMQLLRERELNDYTSELDAVLRASY